MTNDQTESRSFSIASTAQQPTSAIRHTVRCSKHGACISCQSRSCRSPVHCYLDPLELTLEWLTNGVSDDPEFAVLLQQIRSALIAGTLEAAEAMIETALERWNDIQNQAFLERMRHERTPA